MVIFIDNDWWLDSLLTVPPTPPTPAVVQPPTKVVIPFPEESENVTRWIVDQSFRKEQERLKIPFGKFAAVTESDC